MGDPGHNTLFKKSFEKIWPNQLLNRIEQKNVNQEKRRIRRSGTHSEQVGTIQ